MSLSNLGDPTEYLIVLLEEMDPQSDNHLIILLASLVTILPKKLRLIIWQSIYLKSNKLLNVIFAYDNHQSLAYNHLGPRVLCSPYRPEKGPKNESTNKIVQK